MREVALSYSSQASYSPGSFSFNTAAVGRPPAVGTFAKREGQARGQIIHITQKAQDLSPGEEC